MLLNHMIARGTSAVQTRFNCGKTATRQRQTYLPIVLFAVECVFVTLLPSRVLFFVLVVLGRVVVSAAVVAGSVGTASPHLSPVNPAGQ